MNRTFRITVLVLLVLMVTSIFCSFALAANACSYISGTRKNTVTFTVKTSKKWFTRGSLTIKFNSGVGLVASTGEAKKTQATWRVNVYDSNGKLVQQRTNWGTSTIKINKLSRNSTYTIKVYHDYNWDGIGQHIFQWYKEPSWYINTTKNITLCR